MQTTKNMVKDSLNQQNDSANDSVNQQKDSVYDSVKDCAKIRFTWKIEEYGLD